MRFRVQGSRCWVRCGSGFKPRGLGFKQPELGFSGACFCVLLGFLAPDFAHAQPATDRVEVGGGVRWVGGSVLGDVDATLGTASGGSFVQFGSASEVGAALVVEGRVGIRLTRSVHAEASVAYGTAQISTRLTSDSEGIPATTVSETTARYTIDGAIVTSLFGWRLAAAVPFVSVGGGYVRELHEGRALVETGRMLHAGGGMTLPLRASRAPGSTRVGMRADARLVLRSGGVLFGDDPVVAPAAGVSLFFRF